MSSPLAIPASQIREAVEMRVSSGQVALYSCLAIVGIALWKLYLYPVLIRPMSSPLRNIPGPPNASWLYGNTKAIHSEGKSDLQERWMEQYHSPTLSYRGFFSRDRLWTLDTRALNHILTHSAEYQKPSRTRNNLAQILGKGVLFTEAEQHRQQRRVMNPAFGPSQIRELTGIFVEKSIEVLIDGNMKPEQLRDVLYNEIAKSGELARIDVTKWLSKMTLDVIGLAGFNYEFNALNPQGKPNELAEAFVDIFDPARRMTLMRILRLTIPIFRFIPDWHARRADQAQDVMRRIGTQLIAEKKAAIMREYTESKEKEGGVERRDMRGRDLLTLLLKANMATDIPDNQRLSDEDVLAQVPTFLVAGHETTSTATTWCLFALTQAPEVQRKLREELYTLNTERPTMDELSSLLYLDAVTRETLRLHAPVAATMRVATKDDVIPVGEPFIGKDGEVQDEIRILAGTEVVIPILSINRSKALWGEDSFEFKPERWEHPPEAISNIPGVWGHVLSFLGGPRACIGYRFSLIEMKALVFTLIRAFEFELAVAAEDIQKKSVIVQRPVLRSAPKEGSQMPLLVKRHKRAEV